MSSTKTFTLLVVLYVLSSVGLVLGDNDNGNEDVAQIYKEAMERAKANPNRRNELLHFDSHHKMAVSVKNGFDTISSVLPALGKAFELIVKRKILMFDTQQEEQEILEQAEKVEKLVSEYVNQIRQYFKNTNSLSKLDPETNSEPSPTFSERKKDL
eukprot:TRINITY_DN26990_c0_g1_i1.p1 TRINITY_DN26990_c0_g1~~TRINITY_DN26990_c0_g1_i1.p1  ORF type:complete len:168 (+),score=44.69 TRINITY_DN26990_c0_g1_i1:38-505(+)